MQRDLGQVAGASDRGWRLYGTDAMDFAVVSVSAEPVAVAVVACGLSSSPRVEEAPWIAAGAGVKLLAEGVGRGEDPAGVSLSAARAAGRALTGQAAQNDAAAATYVSAVVSRERITVCWAGDCRAYWLPAEPPPGTTSGGTAGPAGGARLLTRDDSLAEELIATGHASPEEAMAHPQAPVIVRWLGAGQPDPEPHAEDFTPAGRGALLLCSKGLWYYWPEDLDLAAAVMPAAMSHPAGAAAYLVRRVLDAYGSDNATAAVIPFPPDPSAAPSQAVSRRRRWHRARR